MKAWSWRIGSIAGVPLLVHSTFVLLLIWLVATHLLLGDGLTGVFRGLLFITGIFACIVLHELGHALVARRFGIATRKITLLPIGGMAQLERLPEKPHQELSVALAGPAVSAGLAGALFALQVSLGASLDVGSLESAHGPLLTKLMWVNLGVAVFNLLPAFPMDGGRALRAMLACGLDAEHATRIAARVGQGMAVLFGVVGLFFNPILALVAVFIWMAAKTEATMAEVKGVLDRVAVGRAMITNFRVVQADDTLATAARLTLAGFQQDFPVVDGGKVVGMLSTASLIRGLAEGGASMLARAAMEPHYETAEPSEPLHVAFTRLQREGASTLVVLERGRVVGLVTPEHIGDALTLGKALRARHQRLLQLPSGERHIA